MDKQEYWLEPCLERRLMRVAAPDELWARVRGGRAVRPKRVGWRLMAAAAMVAIVGCWSLLPRRGGAELRSDTAPEIRAWVKSRTGLDIPLPGRTQSGIRLTGVCEVKGGVEVAYRVGGRGASLRVSREKGAPVDERHRFLRCEAVGGKRVSSWTMRGQLYTLAYAGAGDARDECLLCHNAAQQLPLSN